MKRAVVITAVVLVLGLVLAGTALAAGSAPGRGFAGRMMNGWQQTGGLGGMMGGRGMMGGNGTITVPNMMGGRGMMGATGAFSGTTTGGWGMMGAGGYGGGMMDDLEKLLDLTPQEIRDQMVAGKSLADIAASKGISKAQLIQTLLDDRKAAFDQAVKDGRLTQDQANAMLQAMQANIETMVTAQGIGGMMGAGGMMQGWGGTTPNVGNCPMFDGDESQPGGTSAPAAPEGEGQQA